MYNNGPDTNGMQTAQQRSYVYPAIWALYLIGFIFLAHCFDASSSGLSLPALPGAHIAAVFGLSTSAPPPCSTNCQVQPPPASWANLHLASPADACSNISINPDLQSGCGFTLSAPPASPTPAADLSAAAPDELPAPNTTQDAPTYTRASTSSESTPTLNE